MTDYGSIFSMKPEKIMGLSIIPFSGILRQVNNIIKRGAPICSEIVVLQPDSPMQVAVARGFTVNLAGYTFFGEIAPQ